MEYAFLCYETKEQAQARRIFDRLRKTGKCHSPNRPSRISTHRWPPESNGGSPRSRWAPDNFSAHFELATLAEQRDELDAGGGALREGVASAAGPPVRSGGPRPRLEGARPIEEANAALLAASRGGEPRAAEMARELLPARYPYVPEFRQALELDPANVELRRELAYLLLRMDRQPEAEAGVPRITESRPSTCCPRHNSASCCTAEASRADAQPFFDRVLAGPTRTWPTACAPFCACPRY